MPTYDCFCPKCDFKENNKFFYSHTELAEYKCPTCNTKMEQDYGNSTLKFKINGYCYNNEYHGKSIYRDHVKKQINKLKNS